MSAEQRRPEEILALVPKGGRLVICAPSRADTGRVLRALIPALGRPGGVVLAGPGDREVHAFPAALRLVSLSDAGSPPGALTLIRRALRRRPRVHWCLLEPGPLPRRRTAGKGAHLRFVSSVATLCARSGVRNILFVDLQTADQSELAALKDEGEVFLLFQRHGRALHGRVLTARASFDPDLMLPAAFAIDAADVSPPSAAPIPPDAFAVFDRSPEPMVILERPGSLLRVNSPARALIGLRADEAVLPAPLETVHTASRPQALRFAARLRTSGSARGEIDLRRRNGRIVRVALSASTLSDGAWLVALHDITAAWKERQGLAVTSETASSILGSLPHPAAVFHDRRLVWSNERFRSAFFWLDPGSARGVTLTQVVGRHASAALTQAMDESAGQRSPVEVEVVRPDGSRAWFDVTSARVLHNSRTALSCLFVDTGERRGLIERLGSSADHYRGIVERSPDALAIIREGSFLFVNQALASMGGYALPADLLNQPVSLLWPDAEELPATGSRSRAGQPSAMPLELTGRRKDGSRMVTEVQAAPVTAGGSPALLVCARDITERKAAQDGAAVRHRGLEIALALEGELATLLDPATLLEAALRAFVKLLGADAGGVLVADGEASRLRLAFAEGVEGKLAATLEAHTLDQGTGGYVAKTQEPAVLSMDAYPPYLPYRSVFAAEGFSMVVYLPLVSDGSTRGILFAGRRRAGQIAAATRAALDPLVHRLGELLARARGYAAVRVAEERYRSAVESIADVIYQAAPGGATVFISPNVQRLLGYTPEDFSRTPDLWRMMLHPDDRAVYAQRISNQALAADAFHLEYRVLPKGRASYRWVRDSVRYQRAADGSLLSINGILSDISDRIDLEAALIKSEEMKTNVLESLQEGVMVLDTRLLCIDWNRSMESMTGILRPAVIGKGVAEAVPFLSGEPVQRLLERVLLGESLSTDDLPLPESGGREERFFWVRFSPLRDSGDTIRGVVGIVTDISARKRLEREVRESEETLRNVIDAMGDALLISDLQGKVWEVNREFSRLTGYARSEVLGMAFPYIWLMEEEMARFVTWIAELREKNYLRDFDMTWRRKDGSTVAISLNTTMLRNAFGEPVAMLNIARDISDRRRLALELQQKNRQIELINRIISKANSTMEFDEIFDTIAREVGALTTVDRISVCVLSEDGNSLTVYAGRDLPGGAGASASRTPIAAGMKLPVAGTAAEMAVRMVRPVVLNERWDDREASALETGFESRISVPFSLKGRVVGTFCLAAERKHAFTGEEPTFLQPIADQIGVVVDRIRLFQKVSEDSAYIHNLVNSIESVVFTIDPSLRITEANKAWREFALEQGLEEVADERQVIGLGLDDLLGEHRSWAPGRDVLDRLFAGTLGVFSQDVELRAPGVERTHHLVVTPMVTEERVTGLVFTLTDITDIKRTEAEIRQRNRELVALNTISASISSSLNLDEVLRVASDQIRQIIGADMVLVYLRERGRDQDRLTLACRLGISDQRAVGIRTLVTTASATGTVVLEKRPLYIESGLLEDARITGAGRNVFTAMSIHSLGVIPLQSKEEVLGALDVAFVQPHVFAQQERQLLLLIGNQLGPAIENAQLYAEVNAQVRRITVLYELGKQLTGTLDVRTVLESVWSEAIKVLPADVFVFAAVPGEGEMLPPVLLAEGADCRYYGLQGEEGSGRELPRALVEEAIGGGQSILLDRIEPGGDSLLAVPIRSKQQVTGVLALRARGENVYGDVHLRLLESIGTLTEISLEKALLYEDTMAKSREIAERNKDLDDFTYVVSHDLKEPLISIEGYSRILLKDYKEKVDDDGKEYLSSVVQSSGRMKSLIDDLLTLSRLGRLAETVQTVSAQQVVEDIVHELRFTIEEKNIRVMVADDLPDVRYNRTQLTMVFRNLITNALKFNDKPDPTITIGCERRSDHVVFSVADNGIGIEPQYFEKIFLIFQRLQRSEEYRGTGAGLTIVKKIVEKHRGRIWLESVVGRGTTFFFTVPTQG